MQDDFLTGEFVTSDSILYFTLVIAIRELVGLDLNILLNNSETGTQYLADELTLFQPGGTDYAHLITTGTP